jgi:hypothetical protein
MKTKDLIINLLQQDLKHNQLLNSLDKIGLSRGGLHELEMLELIAELMEVSEEARDNWSTRYVALMEESSRFPLEERTEVLRPLAEICYYQLKGVLQSA